MALPKKSTLNLYSGKSGVERQEELINMISDKSLFFPKGISIEDLDGAVMEFATKELSVDIEGKLPPTIYMNKQRWADFTTSFEISDEHGNINMPFFTLKREAPPQQGTNESLRYTVPQNKKFTYAKVPTFEDGKFSMDIYKIPQPTAVDLEFEFRFYTHFVTDLNKFNERLLYLFASGQAYVIVNGYYMPLMLDDSDYDNSFEFDGQNFYTQPITIKLIGFLQDENNYEVVRSIRNVMLTSEIIEKELIYKH